jgi:hypothetical protein
MHLRILGIHFKNASPHCSNDMQFNIVMFLLIKIVHEVEAPQITTSSS